MAHPIEISSLILAQLAGGEKGLLRLVVAVRKSLGRFEKGDLSKIVQSALRKLVTSDVIVDRDGMYSLSHPQRPLRPQN